MLDVGGQDATEAFEDVGHSDEAREILNGLLVGDLKREVRHTHILLLLAPRFADRVHRAHANTLQSRATRQPNPTTRPRRRAGRTRGQGQRAAAVVDWALVCTR